MIPPPQDITLPVELIRALLSALRKVVSPYLEKISFIDRPYSAIIFSSKSSKLTFSFSANNLPIVVFPAPIMPIKNIFFNILPNYSYGISTG